MSFTAAPASRRGRPRLDLTDTERSERQRIQRIERYRQQQRPKKEEETTKDVNDTDAERSIRRLSLGDSCADQNDVLNETVKAFGEQQKTSLASWMTGQPQEVAQAAEGNLLIWVGIR
jgi:hypothetical protein